MDEGAVHSLVSNPATVERLRTSIVNGVLAMF
jgi:hypothetical protein